MVQATHLARRAYLYVRQSTLRQVAENKESARRQYGLRERAEALGWSAEHIEVIDCDQGTSATSATDREGFQRLVTEVSMGRAGIVLGLEVSRLARNSSDWHRLVELCAMTKTLILDQDGLYDPTSFNDQLVLGIKGFMSAVEIGVLRGRLRGGLLAKAARGELRIALPVGLVYDEQDRVCLHPDAQVRDSIHLLFDTFRRTGTACATVKYFTEKSLLFPRHAGRRDPSADMVWRRLNMATVVNTLHNPRYAGAFAYGRRRSERRPEGGSRVVKVPREQWHTLLLDVHPGYIDWDTFELNEQQLRRSALAYGLTNRSSPPREGPALLQGIVLCGVCGNRMTVSYNGSSEQRRPIYSCISGRVNHSLPSCQTVAGASVDRAIGERLVAAMTPVAIELTLAVRAELQARLGEADRLRSQQVERAQHEAQFAQRRFMQVDPDNRLVATSLEAEWNDKLRTLARAREEAERQRAADSATLDEATEERIRALSQDFSSVWHGQATSHRQRKRMVRLLIEDVTLLKSDKLHIHIRFKGGAVESQALPLPKSAWRKRLTHPNVVARIEQLLVHHDEAEVATQLNEEGLRTGAGRLFDREAVCWVRYSHGLKTPKEQLREAGKLTVREMAVQLGLAEATVREWAREGRLRSALHGRRPVWLIDPIDEQPEAVRKLAASCTPGARERGRRVDTTPPELQGRIQELLLEGYGDAAVAERLNAEPWTRPTGEAPFDAAAVRKLRQRCGLLTPWERGREDGKLTTPEIARSLGFGLNTLRSWARAGRLRGQPCKGEGAKTRWLFDPIAEQPEKIRRLAAARATLGEGRGTLSDAASGRGAV